MRYFKSLSKYRVSITQRSQTLSSLPYNGKPGLIINRVCNLHSTYLYLCVQVNELTVDAVTNYNEHIFTGCEDVVLCLYLKHIYSKS